MKQETKIVAIVLTLLIVFLSGFGLGATKGINIKIEGAAVQTGGQQAAPAQTTTTAAPQTTTTAAPQTTTTAAPQTTTAAPSGDATTTAPSGDATTTTAAPSANSGVKVPSGNAEIVAAYNKAINDAKHYTGKVTLKKHDIIDVQLKDLPAVAEKVITPVIANLTKTEPKEETFENGKGTVDTGRELAHWIIPGGGRDAALQEAGVANATATANPDGGYTMTITLIAETSTYDGTTKTTTSEPTHHKSVMDPLELGSLDLGPIEITNADLKYPGATLTATVDSQGRLVKLQQKLPLEGTGSGKAIVSLTLNLGGSMDGNYELIYA